MLYNLLAASKSGEESVAAERRTAKANMEESQEATGDADGAHECITVLTLILSAVS